MISLTTGLPGAGKTLWTIAYVKALAEKEHRPVFYSGIKDLALDWHEFDAENWMGCPDGSIIVIDECQRIFRPRGSGAKVPEYVSALETHRHHGLDIFLVTQHPMLMDANVRRLTERHWHVARRFGFQRATIFEYQSCKDQPLANTANAQRSEWSYPKEVFGYYKSAEIHTVQARMPVKYVLMVSMLFVSAALIWFFISRWYQNGEFIVPGTAPPEQLQQGVAPSVAVTAQTQGASDRRPENKPMTVKEYVEHYQPRIEGLAYTAPAYDKVTEPEEAPVPAACFTMKSTGCRCFSQQGTRLAMPESLCESIIEKGFFQAFALKSQERQREAEETRRQRRRDNLPQAAPILAPAPVDASPFFGVMVYEPPTLSESPAISGGPSMNPKYNPALRQ